MSQCVSSYTRILLMFMIWLQVGNCVQLAAQDKTSNQALIALAKQKKDKITATDYEKFIKSYVHSMKKSYIKNKTQWYKDNKEMLRKEHNRNFDLAQKNPKWGQFFKIDPTMSKKEWEAKFFIEFNPKKYAEMEFKDAQATANIGMTKTDVESFNKSTPDDFATGIVHHHYFDDIVDPKGIIYKKQLKRWLDKY